MSERGWPAILAPTRVSDSLESQTGSHAPQKGHFFSLTEMSYGALHRDMGVPTPEPSPDTLRVVVTFRDLVCSLSRGPLGTDTRHRSREAKARDLPAFRHAGFLRRCATAVREEPGRFRDSHLQTGGSPMKKLMRIVCAALPAIAAWLFSAADLWAVPYSQTKIIIEVNATAGDGGIQIFLDGTGWNRLEVSDPNGQDVLEVSGRGSVGTTGITELFFESAEPSFEDLPLPQLLARFAAGRYSFKGLTVDGKPLSGAATLSHSIPAGPRVFSPAEGSTVNSSFPVLVDWDPVFSSYPGTSAPVTISGYQVIVERVKPQPLLVFSVFLPATVTQVTVPPEFIQANADYILEVLAIEESGNQTITESSFSTSR